MSLEHPLIDPDALQHARAQHDVVVVDVRHDLMKPQYGRESYAAGHIPGAFFLHLDEDLSGPKHDAAGRFRGRHPLPDRQELARKLGAIGVGSHTFLVAYDDADAMYAARLWWLALWIGHGRVAVLDGGLRAWREARLPLTTDVPRAEPRELPVGEPLVQVVEADAVAASLDRYWLLDARAPERYRGEVEPLDAKAGHIPGARNRPFKANVGDDGRFKPTEVLKRDFAALLGTTAPENVVNHCGSGVTACHNILAMSLAGMAGSRLYPGSWSEWSSDPARPVATGPKP
jgi:thiosulfate/3-mercaptopyruvate sulfurtransferase